MKKVAVILSGCGVYDGSEIHESVSVLLALSQLGADAQCYAPDIEQHHVINHLTGDEEPESRNVLAESARIARGEVKALEDFNIHPYDALILIGGFGAAKNHTKWAFDGPAGDVNEEVKCCVKAFYEANKPILALCVAPVVLAKSLTGESVTVSLGSTELPANYDIASFNEGVEKLGLNTQSCPVDDIVVDNEHKIITTPCYMMQGSLAQIYQGIYKGCQKLLEMS
ncbi:MAG: isoprenoid biosynthesis glyoxalase ElbB [Cellvibrionales bacterium]|nr:isoprenoid biosynthesis glyoxalase ElbB [Cellvibrionales bacterium]